MTRRYGFVLIGTVLSLVFYLWARVYRWYLFPPRGLKPLRFDPEEVRPNVLTVYTLNTHLMMCQNPFTLLKQTEKLLLECIDSIPGRMVCCLQECWDSLSYRTLREKTSSRFPFAISANEHNELRGSGLVVLSSYPVVFESFHVFQHVSFPDTMAMKGILVFRVAGITMVSTHFPYDIQDPYSCKRHSGLKNLQEVMRGRDQFIALGDFNIKSGSEEYNFLLEALNFPVNCFPDAPITHEDVTIDYIFSKGVEPSTGHRVVPITNATDHAGLLCDFPLSRIVNVK